VSACTSRGSVKPKWRSGRQRGCQSEAPDDIEAPVEEKGDIDVSGEDPRGGWCQVKA
jgi:hypothetical protein